MSGPHGKRYGLSYNAGVGSFSDSIFANFLSRTSYALGYGISFKSMLLDISLHSGLGLLIWIPFNMTLVDNYTLQDESYQMQGPPHSLTIKFTPCSCDRFHTRLSVLGTVSAPVFFFLELPLRYRRTDGSVGVQGEF